MCQSACCGVIDEDISKAFCPLRSEPAVMPHMITPTPVGKSPNEANLEAYMDLFEKGYPSFVSYLQGLWVLDFLGLLKKSYILHLPRTLVQGLLEVAFLVQGFWKKQNLGLYFLVPFKSSYPSTVSFIIQGLWRFSWVYT